MKIYPEGKRDTGEDGERKTTECGSSFAIQMLVGTLLSKRYYSRKSGTDMMNKTTGEILLTMQQYNDNGFLSKLAEALRCGDAVKFAKFLPDADDSTGSLVRIREAIRYLEQVHSNTKQ